MRGGGTSWTWHGLQRCSSPSITSHLEQQMPHCTLDGSLRWTTGRTVESLDGPCTVTPREAPSPPLALLSHPQALQTSRCWTLLNKMDGTVVLHPTGDPEPLKMLCCREACWTLGYTWLTQLCTHHGPPDLIRQCAGNLFLLLVGIIIHVLKCTEEEATKIVAKRFGQMDTDFQYAEQLFNIDEAKQLLEKTDQDKVDEEQKRMHAEECTRSAFVEEYTKWKQKLRAKAAEAASSSTSKHGATAHKLTLVPSEFPQASVKKYIPPGSSIWVQNKKRSWAGHMKPRRRVSAKWSHFDTGESGACLDIITRLWQQWSELEAVDITEHVQFKAGALKTKG